MRSQFVTAVTHQALGNYGQGVSACEATLRLFDAEESTQERVGIFPAYTRAWLAICLARLGDFARADVAAHEAAELARANGRPEPLVAAQAALGMASHLREALADAVEHLERGLDLCREAGIGVWLPFFTGSLGHMYALSGWPADAQRFLDECLAVAGMGSRSNVWLAEAHLLAGRPIEARDAATRGLELARQRQARGTEAAVQHVLGEIASRATPPDADAAGAHYRAAFVLAEELGMRWLVAHCHAGLTRVAKHERFALR
jgi:tetratricopeptide (TPR) repeat protein